MKKLIALLLAVLMLVSVMAGCAKTPAEEPKDEEKEEEPKEEQKEEPEEAPEEAPEEPEEELEEGCLGTLNDLQVVVHKTLDRSNVIVRFSKDLFGYTDVPNYKVVDKDGKEMKLVSANSAFWDLGGEITNVFKLVFTEPLEVGTYTITVTNIVDAISGPFHNYEPVETTLIITEDIPVAEE